MSALFGSYPIFGITLRNRFVRSAVVNHLTDEKENFFSNHKFTFDRHLAGAGHRIPVQAAHIKLFTI